MKKLNLLKKVLLVGVLVLSVLVLTSGVYAEEEGAPMGPKPSWKQFKPDEVFDKLRGWEKNLKLPEIDEMREGRAPKSLVITPSGNVKITDAEVVSVAGTEFTVKVWGLNLVVKTDGETKFVVGRLRDWSLAELKVGDKIDVIGRINETDGSVKAEIVNAKISVPRIQNEEVMRLRALIESLIRQLQEALRRTGRPLPPGISPVPEVSPTPVSTPTPTPAVTPTPSPVPTPTE